MSVSLCMIVRNEAKNLKACLASVEGVADEIVVIDTGSVDDTQRIAEDCGARVYEFPWRDDFAAARNESIERATRDWILWLDGDDRIPLESREKLLTLTRSLPNANVAFLMTVVSVGPDGRPIGQAAQVRLFRRDPRLRWEYRVHEQILPALRRTGGSTRETEIVIGHVGYMRPTDVDKKLERNLRLVDRDLEDRPLDGHLLCCRAAILVEKRCATQALVTIGLWEGAYERFTPPASLCAFKVVALAMDEQLHAALECVREGLGYHPRDAKLAFLEAQVLAARGDLTEAEGCLRVQLLVAGEHAPFGVVDCTIEAYRARHLLAQVLLTQGRAHEALAEARLVTETRPGYGPGWLTMAEAASLVGDDRAFDAARARLAASADAVEADVVLHAIRLRQSGGPDAGLRHVASSIAAKRATHPALAAIYVELLFQTGVRGARLDTAVRQAVTYDTFCLPAWAVKQRLRSEPESVRPAPDFPRYPYAAATSFALECK